MQRAVFLDRDGVLNEVEIRDGKPYPPKDVASLKIISCAFEALSALHRAGWLLIVVTNQPDIARGKTTHESVTRIHHILQAELPFISEFRVCPHDDADACVCRKPRPGALLEAARFHNIDLECSFMIGDRWRDMEAGHRAGCKTIFINRNYAERMPECYTYEASSLKDAVRIILHHKL